MKKISLVICALLLLLPVAVSAVGNISVISVPTGATIKLNGSSTGATTNTILENIPSGSHTILLQKSGYQDYSQTVTVSDNQTSTVSQSLVLTISAPTISSLSPTSAVNSGWQTIEISGAGFNGSAVTLTKTGQSTITGATTTSADTATSLIRNFNLIGVYPGTWNLVILNSDGGNVTSSFTINNATAASVTSISPTSGTVNTSVSTTITGTGFVASTAKIRLYKSGNYIGGLVNSGGSSTQLTGSFNLNQATIGSYDVCVLPDGTDASKICGPAFTINSVASTTNGSINVKSTPSTSKVYLDSVFKDYTPITLYNVTPGTHTVMVRSAGYKDYSENVAVTSGNTSYVTASLVLAPEETTVTTTTAPKTTVTTVKTTVKSTAKAPTPWPSATTTPASPVSTLAILGAIGVGLIVLRKR